VFNTEFDVLQVALTPTHLAIVMEYAAGGELFYQVLNVGTMTEDRVCSLFHSHTHIFIYMIDNKKAKF